jgi:hypothetical protein
VGDLDNQALCASMAEEIEPSVRYCHYQISRAGGKADAGDLLSGLEERAGSDGGMGLGMDMLQVRSWGAHDGRWTPTGRGHNGLFMQPPGGLRRSAAAGLDTVGKVSCHHYASPPSPCPPFPAAGQAGGTAGGGADPAVGQYEQLQLAGY